MCSHRIAVRCCQASSGTGWPRRASSSAAAHKYLVVHTIMAFRTRLRQDARPSWASYPRSPKRPWRPKETTRAMECSSSCLFKPTSIRRLAAGSSAMVRMWRVFSIRPSSWIACCRGFWRRMAWSLMTIREGPGQAVLQGRRQAVEVIPLFDDERGADRLADNGVEGAVVGTPGPPVEHLVGHVGEAGREAEAEEGEEPEQQFGGPQLPRRRQAAPHAPHAHACRCSAR